MYLLCKLTNKLELIYQNTLEINHLGNHKRLASCVPMIVFTVLNWSDNIKV